MSLDRNNILCIFAFVYILLIIYIENKWYLKETTIVHKNNINGNI